MRQVYMPVYFELTFQVRAVSVSTTPYTPLNMLTIAHPSSQLMLSVHTNYEAGSLSVEYENLLEVSNAPGFDVTDIFTWKTISIAIRPGTFSMHTSEQPSVFEIPVSGAATTVGQLFSIYASNPYMASSYGMIRNINISGTYNKYNIHIVVRRTTVCANCLFVAFFVCIRLSYKLLTVICTPAVHEAATVAPSVNPTTKPTVTPSTPPIYTPTSTPTIALVDCRSGCSLPNVLSITGGDIKYYVRLPNFFKLSFETLNPGLPVDSAGARRNIIDIYDSSAATSLLKVSTTETRALQFGYGGSTVEQYGVALDPAYTTSYTTVELAVTPSALLTATSADFGDLRSYAIPARSVDTSSTIYTVYGSGLNSASSLGTVRNIVVTGKLLFHSTF